MRFKQWIETGEQEKLSLLEKLKQMCQEVYGDPPHPLVLQRWQTMGIEQLKQELQHLEQEKPRQEFRRQMQRIEKEKEALKLHTDYDSYERLDPGDSFERIICGSENPSCEKNGMQMHLLTQLGDSELHKYYGIYVGDPDDWLDWLVDDGYCDGTIYIYSIEIPPNPPFYIARDDASGGWAGDDASREVPEGQIIFSTIQKIPAQYIALKKRISERQYWKDRKARR